MTVTRRHVLTTLTMFVTAAARTLGAHHSTAMFDQTARVTLNGPLKTLQWTNPHAWIQIMAADTAGALVEWSIECGSPNTLSRQGWKPSLFKAGEKVVVVANPMKDGTHAALLVTITFPDGLVLGPGALRS